MKALLITNAGLSVFKDTFSGSLQKTNAADLSVATGLVPEPLRLPPKILKCAILK